MSAYDRYQEADDAEIARFERWKKEEAARSAGSIDIIDYDNTPHPGELAHAAAQRVISEGGTEEQALGMSFQTIVEAARKGDKRVRLDLQDAADR